MGNFIRIPNLIFAKFFVCKKALKTRFFLLFLLEKDLFANFSEKSRGSLQFSLPVVHGVKQTARRRRAVALASSRARVRTGDVRIEPYSPPRPLNLPPPLSVRLPGRNPTATVILCRRRSMPRLAVLRPPSEPPSSSPPRR